MTRQLNKKDLDLRTWVFRCCLCPGFYGSVNSKKKPHSEEEEKEEDEQEEEEVATALDGDDVSREHVDMTACDHSKQGLETQIASETHNDPKSEVIDSCESSKNVPDDIEKDVSDVTGPKQVMGGSEHPQN